MTDIQIPREAVKAGREAFTEAMLTVPQPDPIEAALRAALPSVFRRREAWGDLIQGFKGLVKWVFALSNPGAGGDLIAQYVEDLLAKDKISDEEKKEIKEEKRYYANQSRVARRLAVAARYLELHPRAASEESKVRLAQLSLIALDGPELVCRQIVEGDVARQQALQHRQHVGEQAVEIKVQWLQHALPGKGEQRTG